MFNHKSIALLIALAITNHAHADLTTGLVAHYPFNGNANDESGNGNHGIIHGGVVLTTDRNGNANSAYEFNGSDGYISADASNLPTAARTVSLLIKANSIDSLAGQIAPVPLGYGGGSCGTTWHMALIVSGSGGTYHLGVHCYGILTSQEYPSSSIIGHWNQFAITTDTIGTNIYVNGVKIASNSTFVSNTSVQDTDLAIGVDVSAGGHAPYVDATVGYFNGSIDDVRIYNRALSATEITELYQEGTTTQQLTITKQGTGSGTVTSNPAGIDCAESNDQVCITVYPPPAGCQCSAAFPTGTAVTLTATPDTIYCVTTPCPVITWVGWGGDCAGTANTCTVNMTADKTAIATFNLGTPEFTIPVMTISPATPVTNGTFAATVTVKNQGAVAANGGQLRLWANQPTVPVCAATGGNKNVAVGTIAAGASKTFTITGLGAGAGGFKTLRAFVDATCVSAESNETNNQRTLSYRVAGRLPDLIVTNIAITPATPAKNTVFNAAITVKNQGLSNTTMGYLDVWANQATTQTCGAIGNAWADIGALAAGASKVITLPVASGVAGSKTLRAFTDSWCEILEANETNNQMIKTYSVQ